MDSAEAYEINALDFLRSRDKSEIGVSAVEGWSQTLRRGASILELGCGSGYPITRVLQDAGFEVSAVDSSPTLVAEFRKRFPIIPVQCAKIQESDFFGRTYDAAIAVGLLFLLPETDQVRLFNRLAGILAPSGRFLFTAPLQECEWKGLTTGILCRSLGRHRYETCWSEAGFRIRATFTDTGGNHYYDLERIREAT
jgi:SAM-dependent methyltransferase